MGAVPVGGGKVGERAADGGMDGHQTVDSTELKAKGDG